MRRCFGYRPGKNASHSSTIRSDGPHDAPARCRERSRAEEGRTKGVSIAFLTLILSAIALGAVARAATSTMDVSDAWSRPAVRTAVVYAVLHNRATFSDRLVGAESPAASRVTIHETTDVKTAPASTSMGDMPMTGSMTSMKLLTSIAIPARGRTLLAPGGYHLMLELRHGIEVGQMIPLRLHFVRAGWIATHATVRAAP